MTNASTALRRALLAAALAVALPAGAGAQLRLEVTPFAGYMPGFDLESGLTVTHDGGTARGSLRRDVDPGTAFGLAIQAGFSRHFGVYAQAAMGETGDRHDGFFSTDSPAYAVYLDEPGYDVLLLSGGISVQPVGPLLRMYAGPAVTRLREDDEDVVTSPAIQAGFSVSFDVAPRMRVSAGVEEFVVMWDEDEVAEAFMADVSPTATAESDSNPSYLPLIRLGVTFRP